MVANLNKEIQNISNQNKQNPSYAQIAAVKQWVEKIEQNQTAATHSVPKTHTAIELAIAEIQKREHRRANVLIFGITETVAENRRKNR